MLLQDLLPNGWCKVFQWVQQTQRGDTTGVFLFLLVEDLVFSVEFEEPRSYPKGLEGDLQLLSPWQVTPYPIQAFPSDDFKNCFHFFLKNFKWQNLVDFWGNICRIFLDWKSLLFHVWWWFLSTATGTHGNCDSYLQSSQDWDLDTSSALCVLFYPILGRAGYEQGQEGGLNSIKSCISPMERVREHKVTPEMLELEKNRNRTGIWGLKPHWRTHTGSHSFCYQQAAKFSMFNPG